MSLPRARDPHDGVDRLPQPFRMLDKILADIIDTSLTISSRRQDTRQHFADCQFPTVHRPYVRLAASSMHRDHSACWCRCRWTQHNPTVRLMAPQPAYTQLQVGCAEPQRHQCRPRPPSSPLATQQPSGIASKSRPSHFGATALLLLQGASLCPAVQGSSASQQRPVDQLCLHQQVQQ